MSKQYLCLVCKKSVKRTTCIPCQVCEEYTHPDCSKVSKDLLKYLIEETREGTSLTWTCEHCEKVGKVLFNKFKLLTNEVSEMKKDLGKVKTAHGELESHIEKVDEKCDRNTTKINKCSDNIQQSVFMAIRDREERKGNVIIHNVPEPQHDLPGPGKKEHDI